MHRIFEIARGSTPFSIRTAGGPTRQRPAWLSASIAVLAVLPLATPASALNTKTWIGAGAGGAGTVFNTGSNWNPAGVPSAADSCVVALTSNTTITLDNDIT